MDNKTFKINNVFLDHELKLLSSGVDNSPKHHDPEYGRELGKTLTNIGIVPNKVSSIANTMFETELVLSSIMSCTYSSEFGTPNLPPHFDNAEHGYIINFQLDSNTSWDIGLNLDLYPMEDNSALLFNANEMAHWRPYKTFNDNEYVTMIFFRFKEVNKKSANAVQANPIPFHRPDSNGHGPNCAGCKPYQTKTPNEIIDQVYRERYNV
jgi:hypothetical protein